MKIEKTRVTSMFLIICFILGSCIALSACKKPVDEVDRPLVKPTITLKNDYLELDRFETFRIIAEVESTNEAIKWTSADSSIAFVDGDGTVMARGVGRTVIVASANSVSAICSVVVVDSGAVPVILVGADEKTITEGDVHQVNARLRYKGENVSTVFGFASSNESVASVNGTGLVTAGSIVSTLSDNSADIVVSGEYNGYILTPRKIKISIVEDIALILSVNNLNLATSEPDSSHKKTSCPIELTLIEKGIDKTTDLIDRLTVDDHDAEVAWYNEVDGTVTGIREGVTTIIFKYVSDKGTEYEAFLEVIVYVPAVDTGKSLDDLVLTDDTVLSDISGLATFGVFALNVESVIDITHGLHGNNIFSGTDKNSIIFDKTLLTSGPKTLEIRVFAHGGFVAYKVRVLVVSRIIGSPTMTVEENRNEFKHFLSTLADPVNRTAGNYYKLGYNVIGDGTELTRIGQFQATLDGGGWRIENFKFSRLGFIDSIGEKGVVKNLVLKNCAYAWEYEGFLVRHNYGLIENVFLECLSQQPPGMTANRWRAGFAYINFGEIRNCSGIIDYTQFAVQYSSTVANTNYGRIVNVFLVGLNSTHYVADNRGTIAGGGNYDSVTALTTAAIGNPSMLYNYVDSIKNADGADFWDISGGFPWPQNYN